MGCFRKSAYCCSSALVANFLIVGVCLGQGFLIAPDRRLPRPTTRPQPQAASYTIDEIAIQARIVDQVAQVQVSQSFKNHGSRQLECQFVFPLPHDGAVESLTLMVDGKELPGRILPAKDARARYEAIVRSTRDPALLEWMGHGMYQTSVFPVPPGGSRTVSLKYNQLLRKNQGVTDFLFPLSTAQYTTGAVKKISMNVSLESTLPIKNIYCPTHEVKIKQSGKRNATVSMSHTNVIPNSDFRLIFDANPRKLGTRVLSFRPEADEDGYFLLLTTPQLEDQAEPLPKSVVFVVDKSGSMTGEKIQQAKSALKFVLNNLREGDLFNVVVYDSQVTSFRPKLQVFNDKNRQAAVGFVEGIYAGGGTNIHDAVTGALKQLKQSERPNYLIFLTDGLPTAGETNEAKIAAAARKSNSNRVRILTFGVGYDVNSRLLDRLARDNSGASEYVRPDEDIETYVSRVYRRVQAPVLSNVKLNFEFDQLKTEDGKPVNRIYPRGEFDLFAGEQLVVVGRYRKHGNVKVSITGSVGEKETSFDFPAELVAASADQSYGFVEKLWVVRRIGEIIDEIDLNGKNAELVQELVQLSTKHGILTPYTSFLADETVMPTEVADSDGFRRNALQATDRLEELSVTSGRRGVDQRALKQQFKNAPTADSAGLGGFGRAAGEASPGFSRVRSPGRTQSAPASGGSLGFGVGGGRSATPTARPALANQPAGAEAAEEAEAEDASGIDNAAAPVVRRIGRQTIYKRGKLLVTPETANVDLAKDKQKIVEIERYSAAYFKLVAANDKQQNELLSSQRDDEELLVRIRGQLYLIK